MKVLVVDDDRDVADSLGMLLRVVLDYDVCVTYSGESAVEMAGHYRPDIVILDVNMPGLSGFQAARTLKNDRRLQNTIFIAHTASTDPLLRRVADSIGFAHIIPKGNTASMSGLIDMLGEVKPRGRRSRSF